MEKKVVHKKLWLVLAILSAVIAAVCITVNMKLQGSLDIVETSEVSTGVQNRCLAYDESRDTLYLGTYTNKLIAYKDGEKLWEMDAKGPFRKIILHPEDGKLYAGNEDNFVYIVNMDDGTVLNKIDTERRIYDIAVTKDGKEVAVSTAILAKNKSNILLYDETGEQLKNLKYTVTMQRLVYTQDEENLIFINNRGEVIKIDKEGNELAKVSGKYEMVDLLETAEGNQYVAVGTNGAYLYLDEDLNVLRSGKAAIENGGVVTKAGLDTEGNYLFIGTKNGFLYVMDDSDSQIYSTRLPNSVSDMLGIGEDIYVTGLGDWVDIIHSGSLAYTDLATTLKPYTQVAQFVFPVLALFFLCMFIPGTHRLLCRFAKAMYKYRMAYILLIPTFALIIIFQYTPIITAFVRAFTNWSQKNNTASTIQFVGLENFKLMFTEGYFLTGVGNLFIFLVTAFIKVMTVPILVAYLVYSMKSDKKKYAFRFLLVLPIVVPSVVSALLWKQIYDPTIGLINQTLGKLGLESLQRVWLGDEATALWAIIFMGFPFINALAFLVFYGGFLDVDASMLEAARADGANRWKIFWRILLPQIRPQMKMIIILTFIGTVQDFNGVFLLTGGGPGTSTYVPGLELYYNATRFGRYGYACALGVVLFIFVMILTAINMRKSKEDM
ncbi:ABC transporter permease subunit [Murimonas intestini]|uniref:ABC-type sugar transport system permease subunit n=1 Tax=Murimonas intestini TaxID=1337051 RepID=A0AB73SXH7_9FIRM|nr:ABC transporter permease subunit [Murimonas intestini]MCR1843425.1 ABC transporter permease subunit [Murimonas intestini]MCR1868758.1 ABC transporter permease subunit [Murimonas intestini]MCR1886387.1 ABC transporter permease subunit [Murimonas intestini]